MTSNHRLLSQLTARGMFLHLPNSPTAFSLQLSATGGDLDVYLRFWHAAHHDIAASCRFRHA